MQQLLRLSESNCMYATLHEWCLILDISHILVFLPAQQVSEEVECALAKLVPAKHSGRYYFVTSKVNFMTHICLINFILS